MGYGNSLFLFSESSLKNLQLIQNVADRVLANSRLPEYLVLIIRIPITLEITWYIIPTEQFAGVSKNTMGTRIFSHKAPFLWNQLQAWIRGRDSLFTFKGTFRFQTFLFENDYYLIWIRWSWAIPATGPGYWGSSHDAMTSSLFHSPCVHMPLL